MIRPILQVEDDPNDVFLLQYAMKKAGVPNPIQVASDGQQAIDYLKGVGKFADREKYPLPCLVLLDLKLPYVLGLDVLRWIRKQPGVSRIVVLLTSSSENEDIVTGYRLGANGYLIKPSEASKLQDMAKAIKDFWLTQNTPPPELTTALNGSGTSGRHARTQIASRLETVATGTATDGHESPASPASPPVNGVVHEERPNHFRTNI